MARKTLKDQIMVEAADNNIIVSMDVDTVFGEIGLMKPANNKCFFFNFLWTFILESAKSCLLFQY
jgi:hypothetical protein